MHQKFPITGMTCGGCVAKVQAAIRKIEGVKNAEVTLQPPQVTIESESEIAESRLQSALENTGDYSVGQSMSNKTGPDNLVGISSNKSEADSSSDKPGFKLATYWPLLLILLFLIGGVAIWHAGVETEDRWSWQSWMRVFMGGFFLIFSFFKLLDIRGFASAYRGYDIVAGAIPVYGFVYPFIELALGCAYLLNLNPLVTNLATLIVMTVSIIGVIRSVISKQTIRCACLGTVFKLPMSQVTIIEDGLMIAMAGAMLLV